MRDWGNRGRSEVRGGGPSEWEECGRSERVGRELEE